MYVLRLITAYPSVMKIARIGRPSGYSGIVPAGWTVRLNGSLAPGNWLSSQLQVTASEISRE